MRSGATREVCCKMSWQGPGRRYYYQRRRVGGGRVEYTYYGCGETAHLIAELARLDQIAQEQRAAERNDRDRFRDFDTQARALDTLIAEQLADVLTAAGYHQHKRTWRRRRGG